MVIIVVADVVVAFMVVVADVDVVAALAVFVVVVSNLPPLIQKRTHWVI